MHYSNCDHMKTKAKSKTQTKYSMPKGRQTVFQQREELTHMLTSTLNFVLTSFRLILWNATAQTPTIIAEQSTTKVACPINHNVVLRCHATSSEKMTYSWSKDAKPVNTKFTKKVDDLLIVKPQTADDFGLYTCHVTNSFGSAVQGISLEQYTEEGAAEKQGNDVWKFLC